MDKELLTPDGTAIAAPTATVQLRKRRDGRGADEEAAEDAFLERQKLPAGLGSSDVANLDDLLDFTDHLTKEDIFQLTHEPLMRRLRERARFAAAAEQEGDGDGAAPRG